ncbi:MAG: thiamine pyrophosphate-binding protein [Proteobacteria bacterium]|nr:thiamine pyrophosphate-binding protein [Pseudomonadota bacterium]
MCNWGLSHVFGMVGHSNLGLADAIRQREDRGELTFIDVRHEGAASFAASAFAKLTGKPAACLSIAGPGATNLLTGLWDAKMDRVPILALTGQIDPQVLGPGAFQEVDLAAAFRPVAEWSQTVLASSDPGELTTLALKHAVLKRNVAHLIVPNEVQTNDARGKSSGPEGRVASLDISPPPTAVEKALALIETSTRPTIIVGHGSRLGMDVVRALAERLGCPVITTFKGKGLIADEHRLACGVLGRSGTAVSHHFMDSSDLLIVFGASFAKHTNIATDKPTIQVDFDAMTLGKFHPVTVPVCGEIGITANLFLKELTAGKWKDSSEEVALHWARWRAIKAERRGKAQGRGLNSATIFDVLSNLVPQDAVIAVDVGNNTYSFGRYFECRAQSILMSGYLGSIGFGYPAAIGAWAAAPDRPIVAITGDGGFAQYMGELCTAVKHRMNITHVLLNNGQLGKISLEQRNANVPIWKTRLHNPNFSRYAQNCGAFGVRATTAEELRTGFAQALEHPGPALVEVLADPELI